MIRKKNRLYLILVSILILGLALPLIICVNGIPVAANPNMSVIESKSPSLNQMKLVREGTVYSSTDSVNYVMRGYIDSDANLELIVYSNETSNYKVTVVDGKTLIEQWSFQSTYYIDQIIPDNIDLDTPQEIISVVQDTITVTTIMVRFFGQKITVNPWLQLLSQTRTATEQKIYWYSQPPFMERIIGNTGLRT